MTQTSEYENSPVIRSWETKVSAMLNIPRGENGFHESLFTILTLLKSETPMLQKISISGSQSEVTLEEVCVKLRPSGIVRKSKSGWELSSEAEEWLKSNDNFYLAAILNANIRYFSEILAFLEDSPKKAIEIQKHASENYKLNWKTKSEIHSRLNWLKDLGLVNFEDFNLNYSITNSGREFLKEVGYFDFKDIKNHEDSTSSEAELPISKWAEEMIILNDKDANKRKPGLGYYPGSVQEIHNTIFDYLLMMASPTDFITIAEYSASTFGISESSTRAFISSLVNLDFIERKTKTLYQRSELGSRFPTENFEIDFACCINKKFSFVFEILLELEKEDKSTKQLAIIAKISHGFPSENNMEINKRLHILRNAKLVQEKGMNLFGLTNRGLLLSKKLKSSIAQNVIDPLAVSTVQDEEHGNNTTNRITSLLHDLRISSRDSSNPTLFESHLCQAFTVLGFKAEWLGGSGKTDILIQAPTSPRFSYTVAADAKSTYSGGITDGQVNFDTIVDHRKIHSTNYSIVIGREFQGERIVERAEKHKVALIDIDLLESLIKRHIDVPLKSDSYRKIFSQSGIVDISVIEDDRKQIIREGVLLKAVMKCLYEEGEDSFTQGILQPREIYLLLKNQKTFEPALNIDEIERMLAFLSSPLINCVGIAKEGYYAVGSLVDAAQKFEFYLNACRNN